MSFHSRLFFRHRIALALSVATLVSGCASNESGKSPAIGEIRPATSFREIVQRGLRASETGRAYDRGLLALHREDNVQLATAAQSLREVGANAQARRLVLASAERAVARAVVLDSQAQELKGAAKAKLRAQAANEYRAAQRLMPEFDSENPLILNALGYFLAERGQTPADFREAERLTRRALQRFDEVLEPSKTPKDDSESRRALNDLMRSATRAANEFSRANTRDSLAWALFRQKKFEEAAREQEKAVRDAQKFSRAAGAPMPPELHFHLGEIYRALKREDDARRQYESALRLDPNDPSRVALDALNREALNKATTPKPI